MTVPDETNIDRQWSGKTTPTPRCHHLDRRDTARYTTRRRRGRTGSIESTG